MRHLKRLLLVSIVAFGLTMLMSVGFISSSEWYCRHGMTQSYVPFEPERWTKFDTVSAPEELEDYRILAIEDLLQKHRFTGWTSERLIALLGKPTKTNKLRHYDLVYWLGAERSCDRIDSEWLVFVLQDGLVASYDVITD